MPRFFGTARGPVLFVALTLMMIGALAGCGASASGANNAGSAQTTCASSTAPICVRSIQVNGSSEQALVTPDGKTLYYFTADSASASACTSGCAATWPPLLTSSSTVAPISGLSGALATITRSEGKQITYSGHPLYTYSADKAPGDAKGEGFNGKWYVATPGLAPDGTNSSGYGY